MKTVAVIGSGSWGTALAVQLKRAGNNVILWSFKEEEAQAILSDRENKEFLPGVPFGGADLIFTSDLDEAAAFGRIIVSAVPSVAVRTTAERLAARADGKIIVNVSKGIDESSLERISEVFAEKLPHLPVAVLSGPNVTAS